jgi:predicted short-subunit dehydrogenase-like oxidoreductase (DUF2520 family)
VQPDALAPMSPAAVIGPGRVGRTLAIALRRLGADVVLGVRPARARTGPTSPEGLPQAVATEAATGAALVLLTVQDDQLPALVTDLAAHGAFSAAQTVVHTAGVDGPGLLTPAAAAGACIVACHPVASFTDDLDRNLDRLPGTVWGITGDSRGRRAGRRLAELLGGHAMDVPESGRARYHAALVLAANGAAALAATAADLLRAGGVIDPAELLSRLVHTSIDSALSTGQAGLSGPWVRGDGRTVAMHLEALERRHRVQSVYAALARLVGDRAASAGRLDAETRRRVEAALDERMAELERDEQAG